MSASTPLLASLLLLTACASAPPSRSQRSAAPNRQDSDRCRGGHCSCRPLEGPTEREQPVPAEGWKRFELRTGRGMDPMVVSVDGQKALEKRLDIAEGSCAYLDLAAGTHRFVMQVKAASASQGIHPVLQVAEYGQATNNWYDAFNLACGNVDACMKEDVAELFKTKERVQRGIHDPCGSTRVQRLTWTTDHSPTTRVEELEVAFDLVVYKFAPRHPHGSSECEHRSSPEEP